MVLTSDMKISSSLLANIVYLCRALGFWFHNSWNQTQKKLTSKFKVQGNVIYKCKLEVDSKTSKSP